MMRSGTSRTAKHCAAMMMLAMGALALPAPVWAQVSDVEAAYQAVLSNPDSLDANADLLRKQLAEADFQAASVTLQRILLINPNFDRARLVRAAVFLRLGDDAAAREDLNLLEGRPLSAQDRAEATRLAARVQSDPNAPRLSGVVRTGVLYSDNPTLSPGSGTTDDGRSFAAPTDDGFGAFGSIRLLGELPLGNGQGHSLRAHAHGYMRGFADGDGQSTYGRLAVGPRLDLGFAFLDLQALGGVAFSHGHYYGHHFGGRIAVTVDVTDRLSATARVKGVYEVLDVNRFRATNLGDADGTLITARPGFTYRLSDAWSLSANALFTRKDAGSAWYSYDGYGGQARVQYRNAAGLLTRFGAAVTRYGYDARNPNSSASQPRQDTRFAVDFGLAMPLALVVETLGQSDSVSWARDWSLETFGRYSVTQSNSSIFKNDSLSVGFAIARRFSL